MASQATVITKKRRGPAPTGKGTLVGVRLQPDDLATVDDWRVRWTASTGKEITRPEALREMIKVVIRLGGLTD